MTTKIPFPMLDPTVAQLFGFRNRVIDGGFTINQRSYVSAAALAAGVYAHDRWKAGSGGCTYTFTQGSVGVNTTITITAGTLVQVIEGCNAPEGGTYTLSWTGTAQARVNGGSYAASPITTTGLTAGANVTLEFATGTVGSVQFTVGSVTSSFDYRAHAAELALCQRYFYKCSTRPLGVTLNISDGYAAVLNFPVPMRANPVLDAGATYTVGSGSAGTPQIIANGTDAVRMNNSAANWSVNVTLALTAGFNAEL